MQFEIKLTRAQTKRAHVEWMKHGQNSGAMLAQVHTTLLGIPVTAGAVRTVVLLPAEALLINKLITSISAQRAAKKAKAAQ